MNKEELEVGTFEVKEDPKWDAKEGSKSGIQRGIQKVIQKSLWCKKGNRVTNHDFDIQIF